MKINFGFQAVIGLAVVALAVYLIWKAKQAGAAIFEIGKTVVTEKINPASDKNIVYGGVNTVVQAITDNESATLGTSIYDATHDACGGLKWPWQDSTCSDPPSMKLPDRVRLPIKTVDGMTVY